MVEISSHIFIVLGGLLKVAVCMFHFLDFDLELLILFGLSLQLRLGDSQLLMVLAAELCCLLLSGLLCSLLQLYKLVL